MVLSYASVLPFVRVDYAAAIFLVGAVTYLVVRRRSRSGSGPAPDVVS